MSKLQLSLIITGRFLIGSFFIFSAVYKIIDWAESERALVNVFGDWQVYISQSAMWQQIFSFLMVWAWVVLAAFIGLELIAGFCIIMGWKVKGSAVCLSVFLVVMTVLLHHFWFLAGEKKEMHMMLFFKNMAIIGALFLLMTIEAKKASMPVSFGGEGLSKFSDPFK